MFFNGMGGIGGGGGGAGGAGGNMMRAVGRAVTRAGVAGLQDPISTTSSTAASSNSASPASRKTRSSSGSGSEKGLKAEYPSNFGWASPFGAGSYYGGGGAFDEYSRDWEWVDGGESTSSDDKEVAIYGLTDDFGFGAAPSADEVHSAVNQLSQFVGSGRYTRLIRDKYGDEENYAAGFELDWKEPSSPQFSSTSTRALQPYGSDTVHRAFHLLQSDQSVQRMVTSLSSDAAIWDAVMNNEVVRELRQAYYPDLRSEDSTTPKSTITDEADDAEEINVVKWIIDNTKARVTELMENIAKLLNMVFGPRAGEGDGGKAGITFDEKVTTSLLLSVVVLLIVVLGRSQKT
ncbi:hypothetical protein LINGRAHAP2_LOCUS21932 [Linum grandiflorum]